MVARMASWWRAQQRGAAVQVDVGLNGALQGGGRAVGVLAADNEDASGGGGARWKRSRDDEAEDEWCCRSVDGGALGAA